MMNLYLCLSWMILIILPCNPVASSSSSKADSLKSLQSINQIFRKAYRQKRESLIREQKVIIISKGNRLYLLHNGKEVSVEYIPEQYHRLKEISHLPLTLYILLSQSKSNLTENTLSLKAISNHIQSIEMKLNNITLDKEEIEIQKNILKACLDLISQVKENKAINTKDLESFCKSMKTPLLRNAQKAAYLQLDALHSQVQKWKVQIPKRAWDSLAVIIIGPQLPRIGEVTSQYFSRLTGTPLERPPGQYEWAINWNKVIKTDKPSKKGRRMVYAENLWEVKDALNLLGTHIIDEDIGRVFFEDNKRMFCDLMAEAASKRLEKKCD